MTNANTAREAHIAGLGIRALAAFGDFIILFVIATALGLLIGSAPSQGVGFNFEGPAAVFAFGVGFAYYIVSEAVWGGSPAKLLLDMRVVREADGEKIGWQESVVRNLLRVVDIFPALYLVGFILAVSSPKSQRLGDRIARTVVIRL